MLRGHDSLFVILVLVGGCSHPSPGPIPRDPASPLGAGDRAGGDTGHLAEDAASPAGSGEKDLTGPVAMRDADATPLGEVTDAGGPSKRADARGAQGTPSPDAVVTGEPAPPCRTRFCESFETVTDGAPPDPAVWKLSGNAVVAAGQAARGTKALRVRTPAKPSETYISTNKALPPGTKAFYGRVFFNLQQRPADFYHWNLVEMKGADVRGPALRYGGVSVGTCANKTFCYDTYLFQVIPLAYGPSEGGRAQDDLRPLVTEKVWHCFEWFVDATTRESRVWWNGAERPGMRYQNGDPTVTFPDFTRLFLGWGLYQTGASGVGWDVLIDELAIDDKRIGCQP